MTLPISLSKSYLFNAVAALDIPTNLLTDDEARVASELGRRLFTAKPQLLQHGLYYTGEQRINDLGIAIPPTLAGLRTVAGYAQIGVDGLNERISIESFRFRDQTDADIDLEDIWVANDMDSEHTFAILDSLIYGRAYLVNGARDKGDPMPLITAESPLNMIGEFDPRQRRLTAAFQIYVNGDMSSEMYGKEQVALYLDDSTIWLARDANDGSKWQVVNRDNHGGPVPVEQITNQARTTQRDGLSEITPAWRSIIDSACRTLLGAEVARELFAMPRRWALGVTKDDFFDANGNPVASDGWSSVVSKIWTAPRSDEGELPQVGQFPASDPTAFKTLQEMYAQQFSGLAALPPHYLGLVTDNPASADAIRANDARLINRAVRRSVAASSPFRRTMSRAYADFKGISINEVEPIDVDWNDPSTPTPAATADAKLKEVQMGAIVGNSDVTRAKLGYNARDRRRLEQDVETAQRAAQLQQLAQGAIVPQTPGRFAGADMPLHTSTTPGATPPNASPTKTEPTQ